MAATSSSFAGSRTLLRSQLSMKTSSCIAYVVSVSGNEVQCHEIVITSITLILSIFVLVFSSTALDKTISKIRSEKNTVLSCDMLDHERSVQGKAILHFCPKLIARERA